MRGLLLASAMGLSLFASACGAATGAAIGATLGIPGGRTGVIIGGTIGAALGGLLDFHANRQQRRYEAEENALNARTQTLNDHAASLEFDNAELAMRVRELEAAVDNARGRGVRIRENRRELTQQLNAEHARAYDNIRRIDVARNNIRLNMQRLNRGDPQYSTRYRALQRQNEALASARGLFVRITQVSV